MSFTVRRVEDPTIYVRRNIKPDILGLSSAWDNIVDIKETLSRLEDDVVAANKRPKLSKNARSFDGKVLKEISSETQQLGKVTRFQLFDETSSHNGYSASKAQTGKRNARADYSKVLDIPSVQNTGYSGLNQEKHNYSPTRYTAGISKTGSTTIHNERPTYFETTTMHPTILNDLPVSRDNSFGNTTLNSLSTSQQFSVTSSPSLNGKAVLARNEAALEKIKDRVRKQKAGLSKKEEGSENILAGSRTLHESTDHVTRSNEPHDKIDVKPSVPLKRKVGTISASGPSYKGFNAVSEPKQKRVEKPKPPVQAKVPKDIKDKVLKKSRQKPEKKAAKSKMTRIIGSKRPQEVITTTSWREGQANVKRILNAKKAKMSDKEPIKTDKTHARPERTTTRTEKAPINRATTKTNMTYNVGSQSQDELSEGRLSSDEDILDRFNAKIEKFEAERDQPELNNDTVKSSESVNVESDDENCSKMKDVLSKEAQSMLADLAQDSSESEAEISKDDKPKASPPRKKLVATKKAAATQKTPEDHLSKGKTRHYDQAEVQKYMAHQLAERKKRQKQEKIEKKKQEKEKQQRLKDLYERQKKSFAPTKKDKRLGRTFSFGNFDVRIPSQSGFDPEINQEYTKNDPVVQSPSQNESDKENRDIGQAKSSHEMSPERYTDDADVTLTEDMLTNETSSSVPTEPTVRPSTSLPLDQRAQRLTALQATALALQSRLQSHALRLSGAKEGAVAKPAAKVSAQPKEVETGFHGVLPGVANIRKQADENEKQSTRVAAATKIQAAYRGHTVRKINHWTDAKITDDRSGNTALIRDKNEQDMLNENDLDQGQSESSSDEIQFTKLRPFYNSELLNNDVQRVPPKIERKFQFDELRSRSNFLRNDFSTEPVAQFVAPPARYEPKGDRYSVMNIFSRRHPTLPMDDILNEEPGSETASLLEVVRSSKKSIEHDVEYEDDFTDVEVSTAASVMTDGELKKAETYSECFETDEDPETQGSRTRERSKDKRSPLQEKKSVERSSQADGEMRKFSERGEHSRTLSEEKVSSPDEKDEFVMPVMASTMQPDIRTSPPISPLDENEPIRRRAYMRPVDRTGGDRLSPDSLRRKLTAEINLLENVEDSVRQVNDIERTRAVTLAQQETVALAQIFKAKQQSYEQEMRNLQLKTKEEAFQSAKDLEKTRQAGAMAATSAAERLAEVQTQAIRMNTEHSRKYMEEAAMMTSNLLTNTSSQLAEFCKNLTATTSAAVEELHKTKRPTTTLLERGTSISEGHTIHSEQSSTSDDRTRSSDINSNQSKSLESSPSRTSGRQQAGYSSDEFESYKSQTAKHSDIKTETTGPPSLSAESIVEDLPEKSVSEDDTTVHEDDTTVHEDDTTVHDESGNDTRDASPRLPHSKAHDSVSSVLDYSSQFDDSSHALTDEDVDFNFLLPSREHRRKSIKRIKDISFHEEKGKKKAVSSPFESEDSFGKFTVEMMQQYMREEKVRTKHQAAILRLREKSLEEKTEAELQWLEQMKKQSRDKGSDDVMPSIKKRERGIKMKLKAEKEEIKCLKAANRAASFQRRFMIYQQQEIQRLHQATLSIRNKIQKDTSKKGSDQSSHEPSQTRPRTSSPVSKPLSNAQSIPSSSYSKSKPKSSNQSPSAKSVTEDISGEQGTSHVSPNTSGSPFPSYSTPKSEGEKQDVLSPTVRGQQEPETSTILDMLSNVDVGVGQVDASSNGELLKIHKMLLERQRKLAKDESEVKSMLQKVTEMLKNQRNLSTSHCSQSPISVSDVNQSKHSIKEAKHGKSHSEQSSIPEDISSVAKSVTSEGVKESADKTANDYESCTFDSDDSTTRSRRSTSPRMTSQNGEINAEEDTSLTETSDHGELKERVRNLEEQLLREKKKLDDLERMKRKIERSAMKKEALKLENEIKNTRDDINRKLTEIKEASTAAQGTTPTLAGPPAKPHKGPSSPRLRRGKSSGKSSGYSTPVSGPTSDRRGDRSSREEEESLIEVLDDHESVESKQEKSKPKRSKTEGAGILDRTKSETCDIPEELLTNEVKESMVEILDGVHTSIIDMGVPLDDERRDRKSITPPTPRERLSNTWERSPSFEVQAETRSEKSDSSPVLAKNDSLDMPGEIFEHIDSDLRTTTSIAEEVPSVVEDESKVSEIPEEISEKSYTPIPSDVTVSDDTGSKAANVSKDGTFEHSYTEPRSTTSLYEKSPSIPESPEIKTNISEDLSDGRGKTSHDHVSKSHSISERLSGPAKERRSPSDEPSCTEPESDASISSASRHRVEKRSKSDANDRLSAKDKQISRNTSDISKSSLSEDEISQKSTASSKNEMSRSASPTTEDEKPESHLSRAVSEQQPATRSLEEKRSETVEEPRKSSSEQVEAQSKVSSRAGTISPHVSTPHATESHSEASSISEEIASVYEDEDGSGSVKDEQSEGLLFGDKVEIERKEVNETGLKENALDIAENGLDKPGLNEPDMHEIGVRAINVIEYSDELKARETGNDILPVAEEIKESEQYSRSLGSEISRSRELSTKETEQSKQTEDEQQYSEDFEKDDASIPEEFSEKAEDSDNEEDFAMFIHDDKTSQDGEIVHGVEETGYETNGVPEKSRWTQSRAQHAVDAITDDIYEDIIADSLDTLKSVKAKKRQLSEETSLDKSGKKQLGKRVLTNALSTVTKNLVDESTQPVDADRGELVETKVQADVLDTERNNHAEVTQIHVNTDRGTSGQTATERGKQGHHATDTITRDLLADAIMQMIEIKRRKKEKNLKLMAAVDTKPSFETLSAKSPDVTLPTGTSSPVSIPHIESTDETAIDNALMIAKTNQILDTDALMTIDDDIAGLLGTPLDDEDEFPVNETNFSDIPSDDDEPSLPEYSPMFPVPHSTEEITPMVNSTVDVLLEQKRLGRPLDDCVPQARVLAGETDTELECVSIQSYRHLVFDLTKEVFIDTISQHEPASQPPWAKAKWKGGQKLSRNFKRWKSDDEIRAAVLERVTNIIGLGAPRATMATLPRKTPVRGNKKDNVDAILIEELRQEEPLWTDYEEDETMVKFQVADAILNMLLEDTGRVFSAIQAKKHVPDNVLVV